jgi:hypothetical protein
LYIEGKTIKEAAKELGFVVNGISDTTSYYGGPSPLKIYFSFVWHEYFKLPIDEKSSNNNNLQAIRKLFFKWEWFEVYDFLEFNVSDQLIHHTQYNWWDFVKECNRVLEREFSGYRFIERQIAPISNELEVNKIKEAMEVGNSLFHSTYSGVNFHLKEALSKLSDKKNRIIETQ